MITGIVRVNEARVRIRVRGPRKREEEIDAVIDTGYTGWLTLPTGVISALHLPWYSFGRGVLADGTASYFNVFVGAVDWDQRVRRIRIGEADADPLLGMALLHGYELNVQVRAAGKVTIKRMR